MGQVSVWLKHAFNFGVGGDKAQNIFVCIRCAVMNSGYFPNLRGAFILTGSNDSIFSHSSTIASCIKVHSIPFSEYKNRLCQKLLTTWDVLHIHFMLCLSLRAVLVLNFNQPIQNNHSWLSSWAYCDIDINIDYIIL